MYELFGKPARTLVAASRGVLQFRHLNWPGTGQAPLSLGERIQSFVGGRLGLPAMREDHQDND
jgi:hypothetical protein